MGRLQEDGSDEVAYPIEPAIGICCVVHDALHVVVVGGIKREGIYYYFKSREEILLEIILPQSQSLLFNLEAVMRSQMDSSEKLQAAIRGHLDRFYPSFLEMNVALREEHFFKNPSKLRELKRIWRDYSRLWTELIAEGQRRGEFQPHLDAKMVAYGILGMCNWLSRWFDPSQGVSIQEIMETYFQMTTQGILTEPARGGTQQPTHAVDSAAKDSRSTA